MTIDPSAAQQTPLPAIPDDYTGLEEFGVEDMVTPRISIQHREGLFKDSLTNQTTPTLHLIILGLVKQRILWPERMAEGDKPMCRSNDHENGFVNLTLGNKPADKQFPWNKSNFDPAAQQLDSEGRLQLPCEGCELKEWGSHPDGKKPFCAELFTLPVMYDPSQQGNWVPALISFQKTQLKPLRAYLSAFQRMRTPPFQVYTQVDLDVMSFGSNPFSVPRFQMGAQTDPNSWVEYAQHSRSMAGFLRTDPRAEAVEVAPTQTNNTWQGGGQPAQATQGDPWGQAPQPGQPQWGQQPAAQPETIQAVANPQPPIQAPQQAAPVAPPVAPQQAAPVAPQQAAPVAPPVAPQQAAPVAPQAEVAPPPFQQAAPVAPPQAAPQEPAPAAPVAPPQEAAAAPVTAPPAIVGGWATQTGATAQEPAQAEPAPAPEAAPVAPEQPVAEEQAPQPAQGQPLPF